MAVCCDFKILLITANLLLVITSTGKNYIFAYHTIATYVTINNRLYKTGLVTIRCSSAVQTIACCTIEAQLQLA